MSADEIKYHSAIAILSQRALEETDTGSLLTEAVILIPRIIEVEFCEILELLPDGKHFFRRASFGWQDTASTLSLIPANIKSLAGCALMTDEPVIVEDLRTEVKLIASPELYEHKVVSGIAIKIHGRGKTYGVLGAYTTQLRIFSQGTTYFLTAVSNLLALAVQTIGAQKTIRERLDRLQLAAEAQDQVIWDWDLVTDQIAWSESTATVFGYNADEAGSNSRLKYLRIHPGDRDRVIARLHATIESRQKKWRDDYRFARLDETYVMVRDHGVVLFNESGQPIRMVGAMVEL